MNPLMFAVLGISALFAVFLAMKEVSRRQWCVLCASIAVMWMVLLVLFWKGLFQDVFLLGLLMGQSITGVYYLAERLAGRWKGWKGKPAAGLFRLPFMLTLTVMFASLLRWKEAAGAAGIAGAVWAVMLLIFMLRKNARVKHVAERILQCCKNW